MAHTIFRKLLLQPPTQTLPHPSCAAPLTAADFGDSVPVVSGVSGAGVSGVPGVSGVSGVPQPHHPKAGSSPPGTLRLGQCQANNTGTSAALEVALQVMVLCR